MQKVVSSLRHHRALRDLRHPHPHGPQAECVVEIAELGSQKGLGSNPVCATSQLHEFGQFFPPLSLGAFISKVGATPPLSQAIV